MADQHNNPLDAAIAAAAAHETNPPTQPGNAQIPDIVWQLFSGVQGTPGTDGTIGNSLHSLVNGILAAQAPVGTYFLYTTSTELGLPDRTTWSWNEMDMANSQIFELTRLGTFANPRIGARWATGLTPGLSPNTANETLVDQAGNSVEINLLPPVHFYTFPHTVLTHGLTRLLIVNRTAARSRCLPFEILALDRIVCSVRQINLRLYLEFIYLLLS
jgi:hypothetical protein